MLELYWTANCDLHRKVEILLSRKLSPFTIRRTPNGKPYIEGNPLYFSVSHSYNHAVIALCDKPVGIDLEYYDKNGRLKKYSSVLKRFTEREKQEIGDSFAAFFINWVIKEAYIKMTGGTLAKDLKKLEYVSRKLYYDGKEVTCGFVTVAEIPAGIYAVCAEGYSEDELFNTRIKLFRLRKGEKI